MTRKAVLMSISLPTWYADKLRGQAENDNRSISATIRMALDRMWHKQCSAIEKKRGTKMNGEFTYGNLCGLQEKYNVSKYRIPCTECGRYVAMNFIEENNQCLCCGCYEGQSKAGKVIHFCDLQSVLNALERGKK